MKGGCFFIHRNRFKFIFYIRSESRWQNVFDAERYFVFQPYDARLAVTFTWVESWKA